MAESPTLTTPAERDFCSCGGVYVSRRGGGVDRRCGVCGEPLRGLVVAARVGPDASPDWIAWESCAAIAREIR
jgi:hypothetical protein